MKVSGGRAAGWRGNPSLDEKADPTYAWITPAVQEVPRVYVHLPPSKNGSLTTKTSQRCASGYWEQRQSKHHCASQSVALKAGTGSTRNFSHDPPRTGTGDERQPAREFQNEPV